MKEHFFGKMRFMLSFHFNEMECSKIMEDYEEWFQEEAASGKTHEEICAAMEPAKKAAESICLENKSDSSLISILLHNGFLQFMSLSLIRIIAEWKFFRFCDVNAYNFLEYALLINAMFFLGGMIVIKRSSMSGFCIRKSLLINIAFTAVWLTGIWTVLVGSGFRTGEYVVRSYEMVICLIYAALFLWGGRNVLQNKAEVCMAAINSLGAVSVFLYVISQIHTLQPDSSQLAADLIAGSAAIYFETLVLTILFWFFKGGRKRIC